MSKFAQRTTAILLAAVALAVAGGAAAQATDNGVTPNVVSTPGPDVLIKSGTIASNGTPTEPARMTRDGVSSTCASAKTFPGTFAGAGFAYTTQTYTNSGAARCVTFTLTNTCTGGGNTFGTFLSAYSGAFNPASPATGYVGDTGSSPATGGTGTTMGLNLAAGQTITLVVNQVNDTATSPTSVCQYAVSDDQAANVPALSPAALLATALGVLALGFGLLRRRVGRS